MDAITKQAQIDREGGTYRFRVTDGSVDRDKEIMDPGGMDSAAYLKNPVVLWQHDMNRVIGKVVSLHQTPDGWAAEIQFADDVSPLAKEIKGLVDGGYLNATSIRFQPHESVAGSVKVDGYSTKYTKWELLEISVVSVPANANALREKSGRVFNRDNVSRLRQLRDLLNEMLDAGGIVDEQEDTPGEDPEKTFVQPPDEPAPKILSVKEGVISWR